MPPAIVVIAVDVVGCTYRQDKTGFSVLSVREDGGHVFTAVGPIMAAVGERVEMEGHHRTHAVHGAQFVVRAYKPRGVAKSHDGMAAWLRTLPHVGPSRADAILKHFDRNMQAMDDALGRDPDALAAISGITPERSRAIAAALPGRAATREVDSTLYGWGLSVAQMHAAKSRWGDRAVPMIREDPYVLSREIEGIGFLRADEIARRMNIAMDSPCRMRAGVMHAMGELAERGHTALSAEQIVKQAQKVLLAGAAPIARAMDAAIKAGDVVHDEASKLIGLVRQHAAERACFTRIANATEMEHAALELPSAVRETTQDPAQIDAIASALSGPRCTVITGGAGTGKTHCIRGIIATCDAHGRTVELAAPTGKAAKRMTEMTGIGATTIHRMLHFRPTANGWAFTRQDRDAPFADVVILDEASMIDAVMAAEVATRIPDRTRLVLVGDANQIPSVGPGAVLRDLCAAPFPGVHVSRLERVYRSGPGTWISENAPQMLRRGRIDFTPVHHVAETAEDAERIAVELYRAGLVDMVLSPSRRRAAGTVAINEKTAASRGFRPGTGRFRVGDPVVQTRNDHAREVFNGETGQVVANDRDSITVDFDGALHRYTMEDARNLDLAYALTVHKSQGSEWDSVAVIVHSSLAFMLSRQILYTAITRARKHVTIIGDERGISLAMRNHAPAQRSTFLRAWGSGLMALATQAKPPSR